MIKNKNPIIKMSGNYTEEEIKSIEGLLERKTSTKRAG